MRIEAELSIKTCSCGTAYAVPSWVISYECPMCASRKRKAKEEEIDRLLIENDKLKRAIAAYKGRLKRKP